MLAQRSHEPELMDGAGLADPDLQALVLADLAAVNRLTRTHEPVLQFLQQAWSQRPAGEAVSVLDVGCGQGDLLRAIWRLAWREQRRITLLGIDRHPDTVRAAREVTPRAMNIGYLDADVFAFEPDAAAPTDYIVSSQLAHHLDDAQIVALLRWLDRHARAGWCIADLRRHWLPYLGFRWLAWLAGWHRVVRIDGTRSIARACTPTEWQALLARAGLAAQVHRHVPFRLTVQALKPLPQHWAEAEGRR
jgi:SAM-dependent methyltransferase